MKFQKLDRSSGSTRRRRYGEQFHGRRGLQIDWDGEVLGAIGNEPGRGDGRLTESNCMAMDSQDKLYNGDTSVGRITTMFAPKR